MVKVNTPDPLPTPVIYDLMLDNTGYMWLGTDHGLLRYNSRTFTTIPFNRTTSHTACFIHQSKTGQIWFANFYKQLFYVENDTAKLFEINDKQYDELINILGFEMDRQRIYICGFNKTLIVDLKTHKVISAMNRDEHKKNNFQHIMSHNNEVYIVHKDGQIRNLTRQETLDSISISMLETRMVSDSTSILYVERGVNADAVFELNQGKLKVLPKLKLGKEINVYYPVFTQSNEYWLCTQNGLYAWNKQNGEVHNVFPQERISDIVKDPQGNYWISSLDNGLFKCVSFNMYRLPLSSNEHVGMIKKVCAMPNHHFIAGTTKGNLLEYDVQGNLIHQYPSGSTDEIEFIHYKKEKGLIYSDGGLIHYPSMKKITDYDFGKGIDLDRYGNVLMASFYRSGLFTNTYSNNSLPKNNAFYQSLPLFPMPIHNKTFKYGLVLGNRKCNAVLSKANGDGFWMGYVDDLVYYQYNGNTRKIRGNDKPIIASCLIEYPKGLLVGTSNSGVMVFNQANVLVKEINSLHGLRHNRVLKLVIHLNQLFILTQRGIQVIDLTTNTFSENNYYGLLDGLTIHDFAWLDDTLLLATHAGLITLHYSDSTRHSLLPISYLTASNLGKFVTNRQSLAYNKNAIQFKFDGVNYSAPNQLLFYYRLLGFDTTWQINKAENNYVNYHALGAGTYTFEIKTHMDEPFDESNITSFSFSIAKPFWQKTGFLCLVVGLVGLLLYAILIWWTNRLKRIQKRMEFYLQNQLTAIRSQMNPHFLFNALNTVQGLVFGNKKAEAVQMLGDFSDLMRRTLVDSNKTEIAVDLELESLRLYLTLEEKRFDEQFSYRLIYDEAEAWNAIFIPAMFIQPFVENAIKHGLLHKPGEKKLDLTFVKMPEYIQVTITDNGIGRAAALQLKNASKIKSTGFAIRSIEDRIVIYNAMNKQQIKFQILDLTQGTQVMLWLPLDLA
jgi:hypothetical protein